MSTLQISNVFRRELFTLKRKIKHSKKKKIKVFFILYIVFLQVFINYCWNHLCFLWTALYVAYNGSYDS